MCSLFPLVPDLSNPASQIYDRTLSLLAFLFQSLRSRQARTSLVAAMQRLAQLDPSISYLADLLEALNAYSTKRIDEPDFDRRLSAFASLNDTLHSSLSPRHWTPILRNMLNFIQDPTELTVRNNASLTMKRFIDRVAGSDDLEYEAVFVKLLYPGLKNGLRSKNEMVRAEIMAVISYAVSTCDRIKSLQEMRVLLAGGDDEANFFNNVLHVQLHRRTRAIRRLAERCDEGHLRSSTLAEVFVPLIGNFIVSSSSVDHLLVNEAINATGRMARQLNWGAYLALTQQYLRLSRNKDASEKIYVRVLVAILDNFHFPMEDVIEEPEAPQDADDVDVQEEQPIIEGEALIPSTPAVQVVSVQQTARIADACCEMAAELIKSLFARLADAQRNIIMSHVHLWAIQQAQPQLARVSLQVCGIIVDLMGKDVGPYVSSILEDLNGALEYSAQILESDAIEVEKDLAEQDVEWQISYHALLVFAKLLRVIPDLTVQQDKVDWPVVVEHLVYPHAWTRTASCRILGLLFAATPVAAPNPKLPDNSPFSRVGMEDVTKKLCLQLRSPNLDAALSLQIVKNLFYIGKCFCTLDAPLHKQELSGSEEEEADREDESEAEGDAEQYPLAWLLSKLSYQARHALVARRNKPSSPENWIHQPTSVLKWFAAMVSHMDASQTEHFLMHILSPVYRITEDDTIRDPQFGELKTLAVELQDLVQNKVGTTKFADVYNRIRQTVLGVRRERRNVRAVRIWLDSDNARAQATTNPEASMKRKLQHNAVKKESRKRKNQAFAESKGRIKRRRET
ncbi:predicted protein [Postia placenta Mad-698-R]|nr:predicted protein [Postia placenta Mad-698-R]